MNTDPVVLPGCPERISNLLRGYGIRGTWKYDSSLLNAEAKTPPIPYFMNVLSSLFRKPKLGRHTCVGYAAMQLDRLELLAVLLHEERHQCDQPFKQHYSRSDWYEWDAWDYAIKRLKEFEETGYLSVPRYLFTALESRRDVHQKWRKSSA